MNVSMSGWDDLMIDMPLKSNRLTLCVRRHDDAQLCVISVAVVADAASSVSGLDLELTLGGPHT